MNKFVKTSNNNQVVILQRFYFTQRRKEYTMEQLNNSKATPTKRTAAKNKINLDYDFNTEYGDGDIPDIDKPNNLVDRAKNKAENKNDDKSC